MILFCTTHHDARLFGVYGSVYQSLFLVNRDCGRYPESRFKVGSSRYVKCTLPRVEMFGAIVQI